MFEKLKKMAYDAMEDKSIEITENSRLIADLKINSYDLIEIICKVEDEFEIEIPDKKLRSFVTIADVIEYIETKK